MIPVSETTTVLTNTTLATTLPDQGRSEAASTPETTSPAVNQPGRGQPVDDTNVVKGKNKRLPSDTSSMPGVPFSPKKQSLLSIEQSRTDKSLNSAEGDNKSVTDEKGTQKQNSKPK